MFQTKKKDDHISSFAPINQPQKKTYTGISAFPPYATEEEIAQVKATGKPLQAMPFISTPGDPAEREADAIAAMVMAANTGPLLQYRGQTASPHTIRRLKQPIVDDAPAGAITISDFITLVEQEEAKYSIEEQRNTSVMITRLRKIFYGSPNWDKHLITGVKHIKSPYGDPHERERERKTVHFPGLFNDFDLVDTEHYPLDAEGNEPEIYHNQEVKLEKGALAGKYIDIGHVFAGLDAFNHRDIVKALSVTTIDIDNVEGTTWVGDLGSILAEVQIQWINQGFTISETEQQELINKYASPQDMLGNIDTYAIAAAEDYNISATSGGMKVSEILRNFYLGEGVTKKQNRRYQVFAEGIGLTGWDGTKWANEAERIEHYTDQVNDAAAMYIGAGGQNNWLSVRASAVGMAMNEGARLYVELFFNALRTLRRTED